jgi:hypothetical protein
MSVVLLIEHFICILNGVCIWYLIYLAILLRDHVILLLFTSADTVLGLTRRLSVIMAIIILNLV